MYEIRYEIMKGTGACRGCDKTLTRGVDMAIKTYSPRNRGQNILFCEDCVKEMNSLIEKSVDT